MRRLFAVAVLALALIAPAVAQVAHVTIESGVMSFNFPTLQDTSVAHFEMCTTTGVTPVACAAAGTFAPFAVTTKAADPTLPGFNLYRVTPLPPSLVPNKAGETTMVSIRPCAGTAVGSGCAAITASNVFILDLSSVTNLRVQ